MEGKGRGGDSVGGVSSSNAKEGGFEPHHRMEKTFLSKLSFFAELPQATTLAHILGGHRNINQPRR